VMKHWLQLLSPFAVGLCGLTNERDFPVPSPQ
jgi:hypothetical protein